ncbi:MAG: galactose mutarotase [Bacteroidia bacterium]|nr:galactose mutarotase [Bacteroidia bacterium]
MKLITLSLLIALSFVFCSHQKLKSGIDPQAFNKSLNGATAKLFTLKNKNGLELSITNYGGRIVSLMVPDRSGKFEDVVLGYSSLDGYLNGNEQYFGAAIGRYGNRIAKGGFKLDDVNYKIAVNNGPNALHGGIKGFSMKVWDAKQNSDQELELTMVSPDMDEGYPGMLKVMIVYRLTDQNEVSIYYSASTNKPTVINLTNHSYFNLHGAGNKDILDHVLMINADHFTPVDPTLIPTGKLEPVKGTPFDFTTPATVGSRINDKHEQLTFGLGYDHNFVLNKEKDQKISLAASVYDPISGRFMQVFTNEPGVQFYCGNFLKGKEIGKENKPYGFRSALCLETQHFPDSPNHPEFPSVVLRPGQIYSSACMYKFSVK